ncbi:GNAT family N-acetyltransferase [Clostridium sp. OS1-26]|uniref:GNAT family N-acetyltransferase n=1 Tax=Clostridium sp. OS1-26 TaxID=3070681 RepID=UPI0027E02BA4|nr:GNAT family N-acetyltransferase [Clostridium sp. OS1-26]WML37396.1 GNAT family N-acetyltransferase [Clostridium sp. OS1-26]
MSDFKDCEICTERLYMRKLRADDIDSYYEIMKKDEVGMWLATSRGKTYDETKLLIEKFSRHWTEKGYGVFAVIDKNSEELMGHCGLNFLSETSEVEVLYAFDPKFWGNGYATEAATKVLEYGFKEAKLNRIIALAKPDNIRSRRVIEKIGLKLIGIKEYFGLKCACYEVNR